MEVKDNTVLERTRNILKRLGKNYDYQISDQVGEGAKERYVFLYDGSKVFATARAQLFPDKGDLFIREPYFGSFRSGNFDFTVIVVHVIYGDKVSKRRNEIRKLAEVYKEVQDRDPKEQDIILLGDFNREPNDDEAFSRIRSFPSMVNLFNLPHKSIIYDSNLFDNIFFQSAYLKEYTGNCGIERFDETIFNNNDEMAKMVVSDHRPVWAEFNTNVVDDD